MVDRHIKYLIVWGIAASETCADASMAEGDDYAIAYYQAGVRSSKRDSDWTSSTLNNGYHEAWCVTLAYSEDVLDDLNRDPAVIGWEHVYEDDARLHVVHTAQLLGATFDELQQLLTDVEP
jgi:hypothetical protein